MRKMKPASLLALFTAVFLLIPAVTAEANYTSVDLVEIAESEQSAADAAAPESAAENPESSDIALPEAATTGAETAEETAEVTAPAEPEGPHGSGPWTTNSGTVIYMPYIEDSSERLFDYADLLTASEEEALRTRIAELEGKKNCIIVILTSNDIPMDYYYGNTTSMTYAEQFYMDLTGYSNTSSVDGFLFLLDMNNRVIYTVGAGRYQAEKYVDFEETVYNDVLSDMRAGNYSGVCETFLQDLYKLENVLYAAIPTPVSLIASAIITLFVLVMLLARHKSSQPVNNAKIAVKTMNYRNLGHRMVFLGKHTTTRHIERSSGSSGGGGGFSGGSHSGGGFSGGGGGFSGGGGKF